MGWAAPGSPAHEILSGVTFRRLSLVAVAALALSALAGCRTNIGTAAVVDGHRISESDVSHYITPGAQPVTENTGTGVTREVAPRSFVVAQLINERLGFAILAKIPSVSSLTSAQLDAKLKQDIAGRSVQSVAEGLGLHGYTTAFYRIVLRVQELSSVIGSAAQNGVDLQQLFRSLDFPVSVSPRYGAWDQAKLSFDGTTALPRYLDVQQAPAARAGTQ